MQEPEALGRKLHIHGDNTGDVAARPTEACDHTGLDRVAAEAEDDRNRPVAALAASATGTPPTAAMTLTGRRTRLDANSGNRSKLSYAQRYSIATLRPSA